MQGLSWEVRTLGSLEQAEATAPRVRSVGQSPLGPAHPRDQDRACLGAVGTLG